MPHTVNSRFGPIHQRRKAGYPMAAHRSLVRRWLNVLLAVAAMALAGAAPAQTPEKNAALYLYKGADRDAKLLERGRQEGSVVFYTSLATTESIPLSQAFEKKTGIKVQLWRATSDLVLQRAISEARGRRHNFDVVETNGPEIEAIAREKLSAEFHSPHFADFPKWAFPAHRLWVSDRMDLFVVGFNTAKVKRSDIPASYDGFLDPKWQGRIGIEATDYEWMAELYRVWGEPRASNWFRKLAAMKPDIRKGHVLLAQLIAAGEVPVGLTTYRSNAESIKMRGGAIDWVAVDPVIARPQALAVARNAPHPHAALLFADFILSPEGQQMYADMGRSPSSARVKSGVDVSKVVMVDPAIAIDEAQKWQKLWDEMFRR
jgi:iron(III) transport system substrate-binding protein